MLSEAVFLPQYNSSSGSCNLGLYNLWFKMLSGMYGINTRNIAGKSLSNWLFHCYLSGNRLQWRLPVTECWRNITMLEMWHQKVLVMSALAVRICTAGLQSSWTRGSGCCVWDPKADLCAGGKSLDMWLGLAGCRGVGMATHGGWETWASMASLTLPVFFQQLWKDLFTVRMHPCNEGAPGFTSAAFSILLF